MKVFFVVFTMLVNVIILHYLRKRIFSVAGIFCLTWGVFLGLSCFGFYGIDIPSWTVVMLGCMSINIFTFCSIIRLQKIRFIKYKNISFKQCNNMNKIQSHKGMIVFHIIAYAFSLPYLGKVLRILQTGNLYMIRNNGFEGNSEFASTSILTIFQNVIAPLFIATLIIALIDAATKMLKSSTMVFAVLDVLLYTLLFMGRYMMFQALILAIFIFYDFNRLKGIFQFMVKNKKILLFCIILIGFLVYISISRTKMQFLESLYIYFCGSFSFLSNLISNNVGTNLYLMGKTQFGFLYNLCCMVGTYLFGFPYKGSNNIITQLTSVPISIGGGYSYNALGTFLHDFIADYGVWGSLFGVFIFSIMCHYIEINKKYYNDYFHRSVYYYILFVIVNTVLGYSLRSPSFVFFVVFCWIFSVQKENESCQNLV